MPVHIRLNLPHQCLLVLQPLSFYYAEHYQLFGNISDSRRRHRQHPYSVERELYCEYSFSSSQCNASLTPNSASRNIAQNIVIKESFDEFFIQFETCRQTETEELNIKNNHLENRTNKIEIIEITKLNDLIFYLSKSPQEVQTYFIVSELRSLFDGGGDISEFDNKNVYCIGKN